MRRWAVICNPGAGKYQPAMLDAIDAVLRDAEIEPLISLSSGPGDVRRLAREVDGVERVLVYGGDGTLSEAVEGLMGRNLPLGYLPGGTGNSTAREIGLPLEPLAALRALIPGRVAPVRPGRVDDRLFINMAGFGFDGAVVHALSSDSKKRWGHFSYVVNGFACMVQRHPLFRVMLPDGRVLRVVWAVAARTRHYAGFIIMHPRAGLDRPTLGLSAVNGWMLLPFGILRLLLRIPLVGPGLNLEEHTAWTLQADEPIHAHLDGDYYREGLEFRVGLSGETLLLVYPTL